MSFVRASRKKAKIKLALTGVAGSGKTYSALRLATGLADGGKIAFLDTENKSGSLYSDKFNYDTMDITQPFEHQKFIDGINEAVVGEYSVIIIDSASHFWEGILQYKTALDARGGNSYTNWGDAGKKFDDILKTILQSDIHVIACLRSKMEYILEENEKGKKIPKKVGMAPQMRDGISFEFTTVFDVDSNHNVKCDKDRTGLFGDSIFQITEATGKQILDWINKGADEPTLDLDCQTIIERELSKRVIDIPKFLDYLKVKSITEIKQSQYDNVLKMIFTKPEKERG